MRTVMPPAAKPKQSSRQKVQAHRDRLRAQGLRPVQIWVYDRRASGFAARAHRESLAAANSPTAAEDQAFVDAISEFWEEKE
jgi:hypothetical protein